MRILQRDGDEGVCARGDGERCAVRLDFVPDACVGESVLVHFGVALARVAARA
jgi:hydrogenase maturation factor